LVARLVRDEKVAGSNPVTPTFGKIKPSDETSEGFFVGAREVILAIWLGQAAIADEQ
jgi:hypothetical protein